MASKHNRRPEQVVVVLREQCRTVQRADLETERIWPHLWRRSSARQTYQKFLCRAELCVCCYWCHVPHCHVFKQGEIAPSRQALYWSVHQLQRQWPPPLLKCCCLICLLNYLFLLIYLMDLIWIGCQNQASCVCRSLCRITVFVVRTENHKSRWGSCLEGGSSVHTVNKFLRQISLWIMNVTEIARRTKDKRIDFVTAVKAHCTQWALMQQYDQPGSQFAHAQFLELAKTRKVKGNRPLCWRWILTERCRSLRRLVFFFSNFSFEVLKAVMQNNTPAWIAKYWCKLQLCKHLGSCNC